MTSDYQSGALALREMAITAVGKLRIPLSQNHFERGRNSGLEAALDMLRSLPLPADPASSEGAEAHARMLDTVVPDSSMGVTYRNLVIALEGSERDVAARDAEIAALRAALEWYEGNARLCRLIHSGDDAGRHALSEDGGKRARAVLTAPQGEPNPPRGPR